MELRWLLVDFSAKLYTNRPRDIVAIALCFSRQELFDTGKIAGLQVLDIFACVAAAIAVDRINLYPQAVIPIGTPRLRQRCADNDKKQNEQKYCDSDRFEHGSKLGWLADPRSLLKCISYLYELLLIPWTSHY